MNQSLIVFLIWAVASLLAIAFASLPLDSVSVDGDYVPFGNDSFYHARRILDAAIGERGFYQFDNMMHVPEGSWVPWSWGYDFAMAAMLKVALILNADLNPMKFLIYVPVYWSVVNIALVIAVGRQLRLSLELVLVAALVFGLLPLTHMLHAVGRIDHHFMELTFVLLVTWLMLRWINTPTRGGAIACGLALGLAPLVHHALFILQLPVLVSVGSLWLRREALRGDQLRAAGVTLFVTTLAIVLPSGPFLDGQFTLGALSAFHLYVAFCSACLLWLMTGRACDKRQLLLLGGLVVVLALPVAAQAVLGARFLGGQLFQGNTIREVASPLHMILGDWGLALTMGYYSGLLLLAPFVIAAFVWRVWARPNASDTVFAVFGVFGLALLLLQYRLNYFGILFMLLGPLMLLAREQERRKWSRAAVALASVVIMAVALRPVLAGPLFDRYHLAGDHLYEVSRPLLLKLGEVCQVEPATVIVSQQLGHYARFHSDCQVIANNFLLTPLHFKKVRELVSLFDLSPQALRAELDKPTYLLAFLWNAFEIQDGFVQIENVETIQTRNPRLLVELFYGDQAPAGYELIDEQGFATDLATSFTFARLYKVRPLAAQR